MGHVLSADGVKPDPKNVEAIIAMPTPANHEDLQRFLGVVICLSKFIQTCLRRVLHSASYSRKILNGPGDK